MREESLSNTLLGWYDRNGRELPWRVRDPDAMPDPYRVWLSEIMLQQTVAATVGPYFERFVELWPTVRDLASADDDRVMSEWAGLGYYARARRLLQCARIVAFEMNGRFPRERAPLESLPGIGTYTSAAIRSIAFGEPAAVVDGNVKRVMARIRLIRGEPASALKAIVEQAEAMTPRERPGDYAQAIMDLGATICRPRNPRCGSCPWETRCLARQQGVQDQIPERPRRPGKPVRTGTAYVARRSDGAWLLERRPDGGLLGGTLGWPSSGWDGRCCGPPCSADWHRLDAEVRHAFTHFDLRMEVQIAWLPAGASVPAGRFIGSESFDPGSLPSLMRKAYDAARPFLRRNGETGPAEG